MLRLSYSGVLCHDWEGRLLVSKKSKSRRPESSERRPAKPCRETTAVPTPRFEVWGLCESHGHHPTVFFCSSAPSTSHFSATQTKKVDASCWILLFFPRSLERIPNWREAQRKLGIPWSLPMPQVCRALALEAILSICPWRVVQARPLAKVDTKWKCQAFGDLNNRNQYSCKRGGARQRAAWLRHGDSATRWLLLGPSPRSLDYSLPKTALDTQRLCKFSSLNTFALISESFEQQKAQSLDSVC